MPVQLRAMTTPSPSSPSPRVTLAAVTAEDFEELVALRIAAMRESLERVGRFDPDRARERLRNSFYPEHTRFILIDDRRAGFYTLRPGENGLHLDHLYLHPDWQGQGAGSGVMRRLLAEADDRGKDVHVGALRDSASNRFYRRHGFVPVGESEWDLYYMRPFVLVRRARMEDAPALAALLTALGYPAIPEDVGRRLEMHTGTAATAVFVAEVTGGVAGLLSFHCSPMFHADGFLGRITSLVIDPGQQRRGIGRKLVAEAESFAREQRCLKIEVTSGDHRPGAHAFYEGLGYHSDCRRFIKPT